MKKANKPVIFFWIGIGVLLVLLFSWNTLFGGGAAQPAAAIDPNTLPGMQTGPAPWVPEITDLAGRLSHIGLPTLAAEGNVLHIHQHLDIYVHGNQVPVPQDIGVATSFISPIHVHDTSGIVHVESNEVRDYTLGQFFDIWGVRLTTDCLGGYCADATDTLKVYSNGTLVSGDPRAIVLQPHQEITIVYGSDKEAPKSIPSSYAFPLGY